MIFISYAQNYEDVMLWRALKHVENGFYVDVGACSPDLHSVTRAFYNSGWRGINVEPNPQYLADLNARRPEDLNLGLAVSDIKGTRKLHVIQDTGLSTLHSDIAQAHADAGWSTEVIEVPTLTLSSLWEKYIDADQSVHFLKVDVEGHETAVLRGLNWKRYRPWIVVVEATLPLSQQHTHYEWEDVLLKADYQMVYWDGLNRFYVAQEHSELVRAFSAPPNVFDNFVLSELVEVKAKLKSELNVATQTTAVTVAAPDGSETRLAYMSEERQLAQKMLNRPTFWQRLFFRASGRPKKAIRRLLFHTSGEPRRLFQKVVLHRDGRIKKAFRPWMESDAYRALPKAAGVPRRVLVEGSLSSRGKYFLKRLKAYQNNS
jgi:FkbM family methyltransferase